VISSDSSRVRRKDLANFGPLSTENSMIEFSVDSGPKFARSFQCEFGPTKMDFWGRLYPGP